MPGFDNNVVYAGNVDFTGGSPVAGQVTADGQLLIGSTADPKIRISTLTAGSGISITNGSGSISIGSSTVLQQVRTSTNSLITCDGLLPFDNTIPQKDEGTEILTLAITPKSATSTLLIEFSGSGATGLSSTKYTTALFQDDISDALNAQQVAISLTSAQQFTNPFLRHYMTSGTTSSTVFKIRIGTSTVARPLYLNGTGYSSIETVYGGVGISSLTITEFLT